MPNRTARLSSYDEYRETESNDLDERLYAHQERELLLLRFPFAVMLEAAYPEMDFADRWCWENFGPKDGPCRQFESNYPCCLNDTKHTHHGVWCTRWFEKTDYDFGFNEWYFREQSHQEMFRSFVPLINWGDRFPD